MKKIIMSIIVLFSLFAITTSVYASDNENLNNFLAKKASVIEKMNIRASKALLKAVKDHSFENYFNSSDDIDARNQAKEGIDKVSLKTQRHFHVEEMCLVSSNGHEIARIVGNAIAPKKDLSTTESSTIFFKPSFEQKEGTVYISPLYISDDVQKWVKAFTTPVVVNNKKMAFLHYEHGLDFFQKVLNKGMSTNGDTYILAITSDGYVFFDSRKVINIKEVDGALDKAAYFKNINDYEYKKIKTVIESFGGRTISTGTFFDKDNRYNVAYQKITGNWRLIAVRKRK